MNNHRVELKYYLPLKKYAEFRKALIPFVVPDSNLRQGYHSYQVHSIYFDTPNLLFYRERIEGEELRRKFRLRYYNEFEEVSDASDYLSEPVWIELKAKNGSFIRKIRHCTTFEKLGSLLAEGVSSPTVALGALLYEYNLRPLSPLIKISYNREPLTGIYENDTRITLDSEVRAGAVNILSMKKLEKFSYILSPFYSLLEIKVSDSLPAWLRRLIEKFDLTQVVFSKYTSAIERCGILRKERGELYEG